MYGQKQILKGIIQLKMSNKINYSSRLPKLFKELGMDNYKSLFVIDVGASGGISDRWNLFGDKLEAIGFDPLIAEVERLNKKSHNSKIRYEDAFLIYRDLDKYYPATLRNSDSAFFNSFATSSAQRANDAKSYNYIKEHFNAGQSIIYSEKFIELNDYVKDNNITDVDFIKIDTDGNDLFVLWGAEQTLENAAVLGIEVEAQFHGSSHPYANTFSNIDRFLKEKGFSLFNMDNYYYSRGALPEEFYGDFFGQTKKGKIEWGEALYFRDLANKNYSQKYNFPVTLEKVVKLACLFELHGLNDCAAELLINRAEVFNYTQHLDVLLNALTPPFKGNQLTYKEYVQSFDKNPKDWFPSLEEKIGNKLFDDSSLKKVLIKVLSLGYRMLRKISK